jgi:hypothetical protein
MPEIGTSGSIENGAIGIASSNRVHPRLYRSRSGRAAPSTSGVRVTPDAWVARLAPPFSTRLDIAVEVRVA